MGVSGGGNDARDSSRVSAKPVVPAAAGMASARVRNAKSKYRRIESFLPRGAAAPTVFWDG